MQNDEMNSGLDAASAAGTDLEKTRRKDAGRGRNKIRSGIALRVPRFSAAVRLRGLRESRGLTQRDAARQIGVSYSSLVRHELGSVARPTDSMLEKVTAFYGVSVDWLVKGEGDDPIGFEMSPAAAEVAREAVDQSAIFRIRHLSIGSEIWVSGRVVAACARPEILRWYQCTRDGFGALQGDDLIVDSSQSGLGAVEPGLYAVRSSFVDEIAIARLISVPGVGGLYATAKDDDGVEVVARVRPERILGRVLWRGGIIR